MRGQNNESIVKFELIFESPQGLVLFSRLTEPGIAGAAAGKSAQLYIGEVCCLLLVRAR